MHETYAVPMVICDQHDSHRSTACYDVFPTLRHIRSVVMQDMSIALHTKFRTDQRAGGY